MTSTLQPPATQGVPTLSEPSVEPPISARGLVPRRIALLGNPNAGKTTLFNALTGMRQKVGNYPGVTVEKKEGRCTVGDHDITILDLPGTYSLSPKSPDEEVARDALMGLREDTPPPDALVVVVDASNLERNLYLATQVLELGLPTLIALNMTDVAEANGKPVDVAKLSSELGAPIVPLVAVRGSGVKELREALSQPIPIPDLPRLDLPPALHQARVQLAEVISAHHETTTSGELVADHDGAALRLLCGEIEPATLRRRFGDDVERTLSEIRQNPALAPLRATALEATARYGMLSPLVARCVAPPENRELSQSFTDRADAILTHRVWGLLIFAAITLFVFQAIYSWATIPMDWLDNGVGALKDLTQAHLPAGSLRDLLVEGVLGGVGSVVVFIPQILVLFFFIGLLEDTGYMARAAFLMDKMMSRVGLHGRSFIPLLSSFACAIPGIMAARTISSRRDRMTTILIAPLMACSARLPVYLLMIGTFIPHRRVFGFLSLGAVTMFTLYVMGVVVAMAAAWVFKKTLFKGPPPPLMLELPPYKVPAVRNVLITMWDRGSQFLKRAGTVILAISIVLFAMLHYPKVDPSTVATPAFSYNGPAEGKQKAQDEWQTLRDDDLSAAQYRNSLAGQVGRTLEPAIAPIGFNWKAGVGLIGAMAAREVFVSTMGTVYAAGNDQDENSDTLRGAMQKDTWPDGSRVWTLPAVLSLLVYFVIAMQCVSTLAVVRRETNGWKWPIFMQVYMTALAWIASFITYHGAMLIGLR